MSTPARRNTLAPEASSAFGDSVLLGSSMTAAGLFGATHVAARRMMRSRRQCCRRRWRVAITAVRYHVRVLMAYRHAVLLTDAEKGLIVDRMSAFQRERGPIVGARALHRALGVTGLAPEVALDVAEGLFEEVDGRSNCGMTQEQLLKVCKKIKAMRLDGKQTEAAEVFLALADADGDDAAAAPHPSTAALGAAAVPSSTTDNGSPARSDAIPWDAVERAVNKFGLKMERPTVAAGDDGSPHASPLESADTFGGSFSRRPRGAATDVTYGEFVERVFDGREDVSRASRVPMRAARDFLRQARLTGDAANASAATNAAGTGAQGGRRGTVRRGGGSSANRRRPSRAESVTSATLSFGDARSVAPDDDAADLRGQSPEPSALDDEETSPQTGSRQLMSKFRNVVSDHSMHMRQLRGKAQHVRDALADGPQGATGEWRRVGDRPVLEHSQTFLKIRPNIDAAAARMRTIRGLELPRGRDIEGVDDARAPERVVAVSVPRPRSALSRPTSAGLRPAVTGAAAQQQYSDHGHHPQRVQQSASPELCRRSRPRSAVATAKTEAALGHPTGHSDVVEPSHLDSVPRRPASAGLQRNESVPRGHVTPARQIPSAGQPSPHRGGVGGRLGGARAAAHDQHQELPHDRATREAWLQYFRDTGGDVAKAVEAAQNTFAGPQVSSVAAHAPRSSVAHRLFRELNTKTASELAATPAFALPPQERAAFLSKRLHVRPEGAETGVATLQCTRNAARTVLGRMNEWRSLRDAARHVPADRSVSPARSMAGDFDVPRPASAKLA